MTTMTIEQIVAVNERLSWQLRDEMELTKKTEQQLAIARGDAEAQRMRAENAESACREAVLQRDDARRWSAAWKAAAKLYRTWWKARWALIRQVHDEWSLMHASRARLVRAFRAAMRQRRLIWGSSAVHRQRQCDRS